MIRLRLQKKEQSQRKNVGLRSRSPRTVGEVELEDADVALELLVDVDAQRPEGVRRVRHLAMRKEGWRQA